MNTKTTYTTVIIFALVFALGFAVFLVNQKRNTELKESENMMSDENTDQIIENDEIVPVEESTESGIIEGENVIAPEEEGMMDNNVQLKVETKGLSFVPNTLTVKSGEKVTLTLKVTQGSHDWVLEGFEDQGVKTKLISSGETDTIEFIAPTAGTYAFYCSVPSHRSQGMEGTLIVEE